MVRKSIMINEVPEECDITPEHVIDHLQNAIDEKTGPAEFYDKDQYLHELYISLSIIGELIEKEEGAA